MRGAYGPRAFALARELDRRDEIAREAARREDEQRKGLQIEAIVEGLQAFERRRVRGEGPEVIWWDALGPLNKVEREVVRQVISNLIVFAIGTPGPREWEARLSPVARAA